MTPITFGTDGWRGIIAEDFTFANLERAAQATARFWSLNPVPQTQSLVVVGYDRRFLSDEFARRTCCILAANGFRVVLTSVPTPTPVVSFSVKNLNAIGGIMITASHNPPAFNGFKIKGHFGGSAGPELCKQVEALVDLSPVKSIPFNQALKEKKVALRNLLPPYYRSVQKQVDFALIAESGLRFAHEALFGVGAGCFEELLKNTRCRVTTLNGAHDPNFGGIHPEPIAANYASSAAYLKKHPHDVCLVTDGDADRIGGMDGRGGELSTHQLICLFLHHLVHNRKEKGRVVKAITTTSMVDRMCRDYGLELIETPVGFKYIGAEMQKGDVLVGAEESGGIGFSGHIPERDGILSGLMLLEMLATEQTGIRTLLHRLERKYGRYRYARKDLDFPREKRTALIEYCIRNPPSKLLHSPLREVKTLDGVKYIAHDESWLMLRSSGTEPVFRIYAEAGSRESAAKLIRAGESLMRKVL